MSLFDRVGNFPGNDLKSLRFFRTISPRNVRNAGNSLLISLLTGNRPPSGAANRKRASGGVSGIGSVLLGSSRPSGMPPSRTAEAGRRRRFARTRRCVLIGERTGARDARTRLETSGLRRRGRVGRGRVRARGRLRQERRRIQRVADFLQAGREARRRLGGGGRFGARRRRLRRFRSRRTITGSPRSGTTSPASPRATSRRA